MLDVSHVLTRAEEPERHAARLQVRWSALDEDGWTSALRPEGTRTVGGVLRRELPERLADALLAAAGVAPATALAQLRREERTRLIETLTRGELPWTGDEGYKKAEVTGGGVSLAEVDPRTLESRRHARTPHLRRGARRVRADRRVQLPLGLGHGAGGRTGRGPTGGRVKMRPAATTSRPGRSAIVSADR